MSILVLCKFTPLGFETIAKSRGIESVAKCKFTPLGFETKDAIGSHLASKISCKFTPLGFETQRRKR